MRPMHDEAGRWTKSLAAGRFPSRGVLALCLVVALSGCFSWQATTAPPLELLPPESQSTVRLTLNDGEVVTLVGATLWNDTIMGLGRGFGLEPRQVPVSSVRSTEVQSLNAWSTALVVLGTVAVGVFAVDAAIDQSK